MTTLLDLVLAEPDPLFGRAVSNVAPYTHVVYELADPGAGASVEWFDITEIVSLGPAGHDLTRGADEYDGQYRASVVHMDIYADDDSLAPWLDDTSPTFGTHVPLGAGLLIRGSLVRIEGGVVTAWNPRFTNKVERWGDATLARGQIRRHAVTARDLITSLVAVSVPASSEENWSERVAFLLTQSAWPYGSQVYGAQFTSGAADILTVPARTAQSSALAELRATLDPAGLICYTDRRGVLIVRPRHDDTFHATAFGAGATGTPWPGFDTVAFHNLAHDDPGVLNLAAFAIDTNQAEPFGFPDSEDAVRNRVVVTVGGSIVYDDDNPTSIQRHDPRELPLSWIAANNGLAATILATRATATKEAVPLFVTENMHGFYPGPATLEYYQDVQVVNQTAAGRAAAAASGVLRQYRERMQPGVNTLFWDLAFVVDVHGAIDVSASLLPPEDLLLEDLSDVAAEFSWTNPTQTIDPTHTQVRMLNPASLWATVEYPITGLVWGGLDPLTDYIFQVRYIRVVDGLITHFSPSTTYGFTTLAPTVPDWDGEDVDFPDPDPGCTMEWELQSSPDQVAVTSEDSGSISSPPWTLPDYDTTGLDPELFYRFRWREMCPGDGAWVYGPWWVLGCIPIVALTEAPYDDADLIAFWPEVCPPDIVNEAVSGEAATLGNAFGGIGVDSDDRPILLAALEGVLMYGTDPVPVAGDSDLSIRWRGKIGAQPTTERNLALLGGAWISVVADGAGIAFKGNVNELGAGITTISGPTEFALNTVYDVTLTHDVTAGDLVLYVDTAEEVDALGTVGERFNFGLYEMLLPADSETHIVAAWDRVIEVLPPFNPGDLDGVSLKAWWDFSDAATITLTSGLISGVADKSSNNRDLSQTTAGLRPAVGATALNGLDVGVFTGDWLNDGASSSYWIFMHDGTPHLVCAVVKFGTGSNPATGYGLIGDNNTQSSVAGMSLYYEDTGGVVNDGIRHHVTRSPSGHVVRNFSAANALTPNTWKLVTVESDPNLGTAAARSSIYVDGGSAIAVNADTTAVSTGTPGFQMKVGQCGNGVYIMTGEIAEIVITDNWADRADIEQYLTDKWGL